jgi:predicted RNase H-like HicB family nuclease
MQYLVVIEKGPNSYGAYVPDLPGCVAAADSREEVASLIQEAIELHIEDLKAKGGQVPSAHSSGELVSVDA